MKRLLFAFALFVPLAGCGHMEAHQAMLRPAEAPTSHPVELYMADQPLPQRAFYEIAFVQAIGFGGDAHPEDVAKALTDKAGSLGCDAVVRTFIDLGYARAHASGVCVKYIGAGPAAPPPNLPADHGKNPPPPNASRPSALPKQENIPSSTPGTGNAR